jgi:hypothetical protein
LRRLNPPVQARRAQRDYIASLSARLALLRPALEAAARDDQAAYERLYRANLSPKILARDASARRFFDDHGYDLGLGTTAP